MTVEPGQVYALDTSDLTLLVLTVRRRLDGSTGQDWWCLVLEDSRPNGREGQLDWYTIEPEQVDRMWKRIA